MALGSTDHEVIFCTQTSSEADQRHAEARERISSKTTVSSLVKNNRFSINHLIFFLKSLSRKVVRNFLSQEKVLTCDELENYYEIIEDARLMGKKIGELNSDFKLKVNSRR